MQNRPTKLPLCILLVFLLLALLALAAYWPGLHGDFLFDDFANLPALGATGPVDNWPAFWRYITSGGADPTGRPIALLSFLLDANDWPAAPYPFKRTNLLLHLINAVLLWRLLHRLGRCKAAQLAPDSVAHTLPTLDAVRVAFRLDLAALLGAAFWLLHPLFVSTTLYIVQREAMLAATFILLGLLLWLHGRSAILRGRNLSGLTLLILGLGLCTLLGLLSKANGILLPALALVIEHVWLRSPPADRRLPSETPSVIPAKAPTKSPAGRSQRIYQRSMWLLAGLPTVIVVAYLLQSGWNGFVNGVSAVRPWTMGQRLLTEPRVLMNYLDLLWLPRPFTPGLFNDQIRASFSIWSPVTTLPSLLAVLGLIAGAWKLRRRFPTLALAMLFYFVGQSLESSTIPLELYFEHRNYLPAALMFWPLAMWLCGVKCSANRIVPIRAPRTDARLSGSEGTLKLVLAVILFTGLAVMTHARAELWGNTHDQAELWAVLNPGSARAQANAALLEMATGKPQLAIARLEKAAPSDPDQVQLSFNLIGAHCMLGALGPDDLDQARHAIAHTRDPGSLLVHWFDQAMETAVTGQCRGLDLNALDSLLDAGLANRYLVEVDGRHQDLLYLKGHIALTRNDPAMALHEFNAALDQNVRPGAALNQAALLGSAGYPVEGLAHLEHYQSVEGLQEPPFNGMIWLHARILRQQGYWSKEIARLRDTLQQDAKTKITVNK